VTIGMVWAQARGGAIGVDGDTWAPVLDAGWTRTARTPDDGWSESGTGGLRFAVSEYERAAVTGTVPPRAAR
jgi:dihydrofolate reductase